MKPSSMQARAGGAAMNRALILVLSGVLASAWPVGAAAGGQPVTGAALTKLMVLFGWSASRFKVPQQVVAPEKDWQIVTDAESKRAARIARERQLREARQRIAERERELRLAREAYRRETSRLLRTAESRDGQQASEEERRASQARVQLAGRRLSQREREAYKAKLDYGRAARALREQRRHDAEIAASDS